MNFTKGVFFSPPLKVEKRVANSLIPYLEKMKNTNTLSTMYNRVFFSCKFGKIRLVQKERKPTF
jgi:hypothetical protein